MTSPLHQPQGDVRKNWLLRYITVQQLYDKKIMSALQRAMYDADEALKKLDGTNIGDRTKRFQVMLVRNELREIIKFMFKDLVPVIDAGQQEAADAAARAALAQDAKVLEALFPDAEVRKKWEKSFRQSAKHNIASMIMRITKTEQPLSKRVYKSSAYASGQVDRIVNSHIARGASAKELAKAVRKTIKPDVAGGVSYAALRLARTEINNAFHAMSIEAAQEFPWVEDIEWHLSKSHGEQGCLCEFYAAERYFPKDDVPPKPHPQCMCFIVPRTTSWGNFASNLKSGAYDKHFEEKYGMPAA
jgi:hypothetical protein